MNVTSKENKKAIRYLTYWSLGILLALVLDMCLRGVDLLNLVPMLIVVPILVISGIVYWRSTSSKERKYDALRKIKDPFYE
jgi:hypothetical protein